jgi:hypothetical protein
MEIARLVAGAGRVRWEWGGKCFTAQGVVVPSEVITEDAAITARGEQLAPDDQVLTMTVELPADAIPAPYSLSPIETAPPPVVEEEEEEEDVEEEVEVEEDTPEGKVTTKKTVKKKAAKRK